MDSTYIIKNPPHSLIVEAIRTMPGEPESIKLEFLADGLKIPYHSSEEEINDYIKTCKYQNIIPFSNKRIKYEFDVEERMPKNTEAMQMYFSGGRTNNIDISLNNSFDWKTIERFKEILFPSLLDNNYKIDDGQITISGHRIGSHENEGYASDLELRVNYGGEKGLGLLVDGEYVKDKEKQDEYKKWFDGLKEKYNIRD